MSVRVIICSFTGAIDEMTRKRAFLPYSEFLIRTVASPSSTRRRMQLSLERWIVSGNAVSLPSTTPRAFL